MKHALLTIFLAASFLSAQADLVAVKKDGSMTPLQENVFKTSGGGAVTIGGVAVGDIQYIGNIDFVATSEKSSIGFGEAKKQQVAILDINSRIGVSETSADGRNLYSAEYMAQVAGMSYFVTTSLTEAMENASFILLDAQLKKDTFTEAEYQALIDWVADGGTLFAAAVEFNKEGKVLELFGISEFLARTKTHTLINWAGLDIPELAYIDTPEEKSTYIGKELIFTSSYKVSSATPLAFYDNGEEVAALKNEIGKGCVYLLGIRWRDVIQRAQLNKMGSNRVKNNHYEGSGDVYPLLLRAAFVANTPVALWKHTIPGGYQTVLIPTHDCDSRTALDEMHWLAEYEHSLGLKAHYFITTHYFRQAGYMSAFYCDETIPNARQLTALGHTVGSHSVCHLPDFGNTDRFPLMVTTRAAYEKNLQYDVDEKVTTGGSTWAEVVMSKQILEDDLGNKVRSFRSGHLCVNKNIPEALRTGAYSFSSLYTANDLSSNFPFFQRLRNDWTGDFSGILEMPIHFSDVSPTGESMTEDNWKEAPAVWDACFQKLKNNFAPNILLVHPNKKYKMEVQRMFIDSFDRTKTGLCNFEAYGDFWLKRLDLDFRYAHTADELLVVLETKTPDEYKGQGLVIESALPFSHITVTDSEGKPVQAVCKPLDPSKWVIVL